MSLAQDEPIYIYTHQHPRDFIREACFGGRVGVNIQEFRSSVCAENLVNLQNH